MYISWCFQRISQIQALVLFKMLVIPQFHPVFLHSIPFGAGALKFYWREWLCLGLNEFECRLLRVDCTAKSQKMFTIRTPPPEKKPLIFLQRFYYCWGSWRDQSLKSSQCLSRSSCVYSFVIHSSPLFTKPTLMNRCLWYTYHLYLYIL